MTQTTRGLRRAFRLIDEPNHPGSLSSRARAQRWSYFVSTFPEIGQLRILDLGGTPEYWYKAPVRPSSVTIVNLDGVNARPEPWITQIVGDATSLPARLGHDYDLVVSNSLLEHLGGHVMRQRFAEQVRTRAPWHWIQTPYRYFPVEPHWLVPFMQQLPFEFRAAISEKWPFGQSISPDRDTARNDVAMVELIGISEMKMYFPESRVWKERFGPLIKSLVAVKR